MHETLNEVLPLSTIVYDKYENIIIKTYVELFQSVSCNSI